MPWGPVERVRRWLFTPADPAPPIEPPASAEATRRRDRTPTPAERQLTETVAHKLLHGWLQNRHQTLMPMSLNLARLPPEGRERIARFAAVAATAGTDTDAAGRLASLLAEGGADPSTLAAFEAALISPPDLRRALADVAEPDCAGIAYVLALVAARTGEAGSAGPAFADYVAKRFTLPNAALRSAQRRYGG